jgi:hypothetical protein
MSSTQGSQIIYYAPYVNQFVPIWDGSTLQQYNFCSSLSDQVGLSFNMAGSSTFPINTSYDVFVTINGGLPILALVAWTNPGPSPAPLRATALSIFGGMLTNATTATMRISVAGTLSVPANQATFLGTIGTSPSITGFCPFQYGAAAVGGSPAYFGLCNYYNKCLFNTIVQDSGVPYTYTPATVRQARASAGNQISYIQSDSERAATFSYNAPVSTVAALGAFTVTGIGTQTTSFQVFTLFQAGSASVLNSNSTTVYQLSNTGLANIVALEQGDGTYANTFGQSSLLGGSIWL